MDEEISIIMPVYNSEKTIEATIKSIIDQSYKNFELIIVNDGSTDKTVNICKKYLEKANIKLINICNSGPSYARNRGVYEANGKYLMFIDADDTYQHDMLKNMHNLMVSNNADVVVCNYLYKNNYKIKKISNIIDKYYSSTQIEKCIKELMEKKLFNVVWNKIYRTDIIKKNNLKFNEGIELGEDYRFNIDYFELVKNAYITDKDLYVYNITLDSICSKSRKNLFELKVANVDYQKEMYMRKSFSTEVLVNKYIECLTASVSMLVNEKNIRLKEKINIISCQRDAIYIKIRNIKTSKIKKENKLIRILIMHKFNLLIYCYIKIKTVLKVFLYKIGKKQYR